jgi:hypothetical protein
VLVSSKLRSFVVSDDTPEVGAIIDRQGFDGLTYVIATGTLADVDATFTILLEEGDDSGLSDAAAVADADLLGTEALAAFTFTNDDATRKLGYLGSKRYTRLTITPAANTGSAPISAVAILGWPSVAATANPPV